MASPVATYLAAVPDDQREALARLRALLLDAVPEAEEAIKTRVPEAGGSREKGRS